MSSEEEIPLDEVQTPAWKFQWLSLHTAFKNKHFPKWAGSYSKPFTVTVPLQRAGKVSERRVVFGACWRLRVTTTSTSEGVSQPLWQWIKLRTAEYQTPGLTVFLFQAMTCGQSLSPTRNCDNYQLLLLLTLRRRLFQAFIEEKNPWLIWFKAHLQIRQRDH